VKHATYREFEGGARRAEFLITEVGAPTCTVPATANSGTYFITPYAGDLFGNWVNTNGGPTSDARGSFAIT
jgi:hypothetical protein